MHVMKCSVKFNDEWHTQVPRLQIFQTTDEELSNTKKTSEEKWIQNPGAPWLERRDEFI